MKVRLTASPSSLLARFLPLVGAGVIVWLVFFMPPLILRGSGSVADARVYCDALMDRVLVNAPLEGVENPFQPAARSEAARQYNSCMADASVNVPLLLLQVAVAVAVTLALLWVVKR